MIRDAKVFREELEKANRFWLTGKVEESDRYPIEREEVEEICRDAKLKKISIISGPRRVGKSIVIKHVIARLIKRGVKPRNILSYSMENPYLKLYCDNLIKDTFDFWLENIAEEGERCVFFDEIHFVDEWYTWLKVLYDRHKDIKVFISGSASLTLQREANKYLRGRYIYHELWPLNFRQFLKFTGRQVEEFKNEHMAVDRLLDKYKGDFRQYMLAGGFPEFFEVRDMKDWYEILKNSVSNKAIYEDIATAYKIRNVRILEQVFLFIVANQSKILSYEKINEVAGLKHEILLNYLEYLKFSYLIVEILKHAKNIKEQLRSKKKFLCVDQGLRNALISEYEVKENNEGFIIENIVGIHLYTSTFKKGKQVFYYRINGEADFVVNGQKKALIEVKYRKDITKGDIDKVRKIMKDTGCTEAYVVTKNDFRIVKNNGMKIMLVPALIFCLFIEEFV